MEQWNVKQASIADSPTLDEHAVTLAYFNTNVPSAPTISDLETENTTYEYYKPSC